MTPKQAALLKKQKADEEQKPKRPAGRPCVYPTGGRKVTLYLPNEDAEKLKRLGSSKWLRERLAEEPDE